MNYAIRNGRALLLAAGLIIVAGLAAVQSLPRNEDPNLTNRFGVILTSLQGGSAEVVEALVTEKLEDELRTIPEILRIDSVSSVGLSAIFVLLGDSVGPENVDRVWAKIRSELEDTAPILPADSGPPRLDVERSGAYSLILGMYLRSDNRSQRPALKTYADVLETRLRRVLGTDRISIYGLPNEEILVGVDDGLASSLGLSVRDVSRQINHADSKGSTSVVDDRVYRYKLEIDSGVDDIGRIGRIVLKNNNGAVVTVDDVATISRGAREPPETLALINQHRGVAIAIRMSPTQRSDIWRKRTEAVIERFQRELPDNVRFEILFDQEPYTHERISNLLLNLAIGLLLVITALPFFIGWRATLVVAFTLPLNVLFALSCMNYVGLDIQQISIVGLIVSLGIMVDNNIVMMHTVDRYARTEPNGYLAADRAISQLWLPLLGSTLTTIMMFMPIALLTGEGGEFTSGIALAVIFSLVGSYMIAHTITAGLAARLCNGGLETNRYVAQLIRNRGSLTLEKLVRKAILHPVRTLAIVLCVPFIGFFLASKLPQQFFPPSDRDMINLEVFLPVNSSILATEELVKKIDNELLATDDIEASSWFVGSSAPSFYYNIAQRGDGARYYAQAIIKMSGVDALDRQVHHLQMKLDDLFPEAQIILRRLSQGAAPLAPVEIRVYGPDLDVLSQVGADVKRRLLALPGVTHSRVSLSERVPRLRFSLDNVTLSDLSLSLSEVARQTRDAVDGTLNATLQEFDQSIPIRVFAATDDQRSNLDVSELPVVGLGVSTRLAENAPIAALGELIYDSYRVSIPRRNGERVNTIGAYVRDGVVPSSVVRQFQSDLKADPLELPEGYRLELGGESEKRSEAIEKLIASLGTIAVAFVIALVMSLNSFRLTLVVITVAMQAVGLGLLVLSVSGYPFGFMSIIGLMGLMGLAINSSIVIIAELRSNPFAVKGDVDSMVACVSNCSGHILATTVTTVAGFIPLIASSGEFWPPFAIVVAGGTVLATIVSFFYVPALFRIIALRRSIEPRVLGGAVNKIEIS